MANLTGKTVSELPNASDLTGSELIPISQGGATKKVTPSALVNGMLVAELYRVVDSASIPAGASSYSPTVTKAGYFPIGLIGFRGMTGMYFSQYRVKTASAGSAELEIAIYNTGSATTGTVAVNILWAKLT